MQSCAGRANYRFEGITPQRRIALAQERLDVQAGYGASKHCVRHRTSYSEPQLAQLRQINITGLDLGVVI